MNTTSRLRRYVPALLGGTFLGLVITTSSLAYEADMVRAFIGGDTQSATAIVQGPSPADLVAANECWTGEAPADMAGQVPGHVVVTMDGTARVGGDRLVGKALGQMFDGADHGLTIHAFCR
jgi:hypothetical protein